MAAKPPQVTVSRPSDTTKGLCDRPLETFARPFPEISWFPALVGRGGSVSRRDLNLLAENRVQLSGGTKPAESTSPNASRSSGGSAREGKDSHSRQWRLSMAVFLNRNKRPLAAPIEVAELLAEKPPPSHTPVTFPLVRFLLGIFPACA